MVLRLTEKVPYTIGMVVSIHVGFSEVLGSPPLDPKDKRIRGVKFGAPISNTASSTASE